MFYCKKMEGNKVEKYNRHKTVVNSNFKVCVKCNENKTFKNFVALSSDITQRRDICRKCEADLRKQKSLESPTKYCPPCGRTLNKTEFRSDKSRMDGLYGLCKSCKSIQDKNYKKNNPEKMKQLAKKRMENPHNRIAHNLRVRLKNVVVRRDKSTIEYVGIDNKSFLKWLEYQFDDNMSWNNYGSYWQIDHVIPCAQFDLTKEEEIHKCFNWTNMRPLEKTEKTENNSKNSKIINFDIENQKLKVELYKKSLEV
jgi:hypothetical protein